jgi:hypothetical protein
MDSYYPTNMVPMSTCIDASKFVEIRKKKRESIVPILDLLVLNSNALSIRERERERDQ